MAPMKSPLLRGQCRFEFERHEFVPAGEAASLDDACWLHASSTAKSELASLIGIDPQALEYVGWIELAFYGHLNPVRGQYGHFGMFTREATLHEVVEAHILHPAYEAQPGPMDIRGRVLRGQSLRQD